MIRLRLWVIDRKKKFVVRFGVKVDDTSFEIWRSDLYSLSERI
jgi:hypothetical protein